MSNKLSITSELVALREDALGAVRHAENLLDLMGLLKSRTVGGNLHVDRVLKSIELEKENDNES